VGAKKYRELAEELDGRVYPVVKPMEPAVLSEEESIEIEESSLNVNEGDAHV
jgi:hypothetical protein